MIGSPLTKKYWLTKVERTLKLLNSRYEVGNPSNRSDKIEEALACLRLKIAVAYKGIRAIFPDIGVEGVECLTGLVDILREKRQQVTGEISSLGAENKERASSTQDLQKRLGKEAHANGGRLRRFDGVVENARPRTEPPSLPNGNLNTVRWMM